MKKHLNAILLPSIDPKNLKAWFNKGITYESLDNSQETLECYNKVIKLDLKNVKVWYHKGKVLQKLGMDQEAFECYETALKLDPDFEPAKKQKKSKLLNFR